MSTTTTTTTKKKKTGPRALDLTEDAEPATQELSKDVEALKTDFDALRDDIRGLTRTLADVGKDTAAGARRTLDAKATELQADVRKHWDDGVEYARRSATERPVATAAAVFGVGLLIGRLLRR